MVYASAPGSPMSGEHSSPPASVPVDSTCLQQGVCAQCGASSLIIEAHNDDRTVSVAAADTIENGPLVPSTASASPYTPSSANSIPTPQDLEPQNTALENVANARFDMDAISDSSPPPYEDVPPVNVFLNNGAPTLPQLEAPQQNETVNALFHPNAPILPLLVHIPAPLNPMFWTYGMFEQAVRSLSSLLCRYHR